MTKYRLQATGLALGEFLLLDLNTWIISKLQFNGWADYVVWGIAFSLIITTIIGLAFSAIWFNENKPFTEFCFDDLLSRFNRGPQETLQEPSGLSDYVNGKFVSKRNNKGKHE